MKITDPAVKDKAREILATHAPKPLPKDQDIEIDRILKEAEQWYREKS